MSTASGQTSTFVDIFQVYFEVFIRHPLSLLPLPLALDLKQLRIASACMRACVYVCVCVHACMHVCMYWCKCFHLRLHIEAL